MAEIMEKFSFAGLKNYYENFKRKRNENFLKIGACNWTKNCVLDSMKSKRSQKFCQLPFHPAVKLSVR